MQELDGFIKPRFICKAKQHNVMRFGLTGWYASSLSLFLLEMKLQILPFIKQIDIKRKLSTVDAVYNVAFGVWRTEARNDMKRNIGKLLSANEVVGLKMTVTIELNDFWHISV